MLRPAALLTLAFLAAPYAHAGKGYYTYGSSFHYTSEDSYQIYVQPTPTRKWNKTSSSARVAPATPSRTPASQTLDTPKAAAVKPKTTTPKAPLREAAAPPPAKKPATVPSKKAEAAPAGDQCLAKGDRDKTAGNLQQGANALRATAQQIVADSQQLVKLIGPGGLHSEVPKCEPNFGPLVAQAIDEKHEGKSLLQKLQDLGVRAKEASDKLASALDGAKASYQKLDFCSVSACGGAFAAVGGLFSPVSTQADASLKILADLRKQYIMPAKKVLEERRSDIEMVIAGDACVNAQKSYRQAMSAWKTIQTRFDALETRVRRESQTAKTVAQSAGRAGSCGTATMASAESVGRAPASGSTITMSDKK